MPPNLAIPTLNAITNLPLLSQLLSQNGNYNNNGKTINDTNNLTGEEEIFFDFDCSWFGIYDINDNDISYHFNQRYILFYIMGLIIFKEVIHYKTNGFRYYKGAHLELYLIDIGLLYVSGFMVYKLYLNGL